MVEYLKRIIREYQSLEPPGGLPPRRVVIGGLPGKVSVLPRVKGSEIRSLSEAMVELAVAEGIIVTWRTDETIPVGFGTIQVVPVWRFLLEMEPRA